MILALTLMVIYFILSNSSDTPATPTATATPGSKPTGGSKGNSTGSSISNTISAIMPGAGLIADITGLFTGSTADGSNTASDNTDGSPETTYSNAPGFTVYANGSTSTVQQQSGTGPTPDSIIFTGSDPLAPTSQLILYAADQSRPKRKCW